MSISSVNGVASTVSRYRFVAAGGETSVSGTDANGATLSYLAGKEEVYLNGALLVRGQDYTGNDGATISALTALVAGDTVEIITFVPFAIPTAISSATVTTQGDLIVATGAGAVTRLGVGTDGTTLVANSASATGVAWAGPTFTAGKNKIINGDFGIWQRGTSFSNPVDNTYTADRFTIYGNGSGATKTVSQQTFTPGTAPVAGYESAYFFRFAQSVAGTSATYSGVYHRIEDVRTFAGQTVTLSLWAKTDSARTLSLAINRNYGSGGSSQDYSVVTDSNISVTTGWTRFTYTFSMPSVAGKTIGAGSYVELGVKFVLNATQTNDVWGVQLEAGSVATPFTTATGTLSGELTACQRYYVLIARGLNSVIGNGFNYSTTNITGYITLPVDMRTTPTLDAFSGTNVFGFLRNGGSNTFNSFTIDQANSRGVSIYNNTQASGTAGQAGYLYNYTSSSYVAFSAEL